MKRVTAMSDEEVVRHVLSSRNNYYSILFVERTSTTEEIKSAYKKMALRCHPDKNKHAQAAEAFKLVGGAHATLIDPTKRKIYNQSGERGVQRHESGGGAGRGGGGGFRNGYARQGVYQQRDFFEGFFFGGMGQTGPQPQRQQAGGRAGPGVHAEFNGVEINPNLILLLPIIIFVILAMLLQSNTADFSSSSAAGQGSRGGRQPSRGSGVPFSLTPSSEDGLVIKRVTSLRGLEVPFYISRRSAEVVERRRDILSTTEQEVLRSQRDYLGNRCEAETFKHRSRGRTDAPEVCTEYHRFRRSLG